MRHQQDRPASLHREPPNIDPARRIQDVATDVPAGDDEVGSTRLVCNIVIEFRRE